jgi:hypothetical protein
VQIGAIDVLPKLFDRIVIPTTSFHYRQGLLEAFLAQKPGPKR